MNLICRRVARDFMRVGLAGVDRKMTVFACAERKVDSLFRCLAPTMLSCWCCHFNLSTLTGILRAQHTRAEPAANQEKHRITQPTGTTAWPFSTQKWGHGKSRINLRPCPRNDAMAHATHLEWICPPHTISGNLKYQVQQLWTNVKSSIGIAPDLFTSLAIK